MNKRIELLEKMVESGTGDSFAQYALALEYRKENRVDDAISTFRALRARDPDYLPMYLMAGQIHVAASRLAEARDWLLAGIALAKVKGDHKALGEMEAELSHAESTGDG
jgi:predicted Zn-dependent protease